MNTVSQIIKYTFVVFVICGMFAGASAAYALSPTKNLSTLNAIEAVVHGGAGVQSFVGTLLIGSQYPISLAQSMMLQVLAPRDQEGNIIGYPRPAVFTRSLAPGISNSFFTVLQNAQFSSRVFVGFAKETFSEKGTTTTPGTTEWESIATNSPSVSIGLQRLNVRGKILATNLNGINGNVTGQNAICVDAAGTLVLCQPKDPVVDFRFDECAYSTNPGAVIDTVGNVTNATALGSVSTSDLGRIGRRLELTSAANERVSATDSRFSVNLNEQFTVATWARMTGDASLGTSWIADAHNSCIGWSLYVDTGDVIRARLTTGNDCANIDSSIQIGTNPGLLSDGSWHHVALVVDRVNHEIMLYVDGERKAFTYLPSSGLSSTSTHNFSIGGSHNAPSESFQNGSIDEFKVYENILTNVEVRELYLTEKSQTRSITCS